MEYGIEAGRIITINGRAAVYISAVKDATGQTRITPEEADQLTRRIVALLNQADDQESKRFTVHSSVGYFWVKDQLTGEPLQTPKGSMRKFQTLNRARWVARDLNRKHEKNNRTRPVGKL